MQISSTIEQLKHDYIIHDVFEMAYMYLPTQRRVTGVSGMCLPHTPRHSVQGSHEYYRYRAQDSGSHRKSTDFKQHRDSKQHQQPAADGHAQWDLLDAEADGRVTSSSSTSRSCTYASSVPSVHSV